MSIEEELRTEFERVVRGLPMLLESATSGEATKADAIGAIVGIVIPMLDAQRSMILRLAAVVDGITSSS